MAIRTNFSYNRPPTKLVDFQVDPLLSGLLSLCSPHQYEAHIIRFIKDNCPFLSKHEVKEVDGNLLVQVGQNRDTVFSCHMDIVGDVCKENASRGKVDQVALMTPVPTNKEKGESRGVIYGAKAYFNAETGDFSDYRPSTLGADDKVGVYINLKLIEKEVPGLYLFHVGEEKGGIGSGKLAKDHKDIFDGVKRAIAFDRAGYQDVIEFQRNGRCCSPEFAEDLARKLNVDLPKFAQYKAGVHGTFTDTANYRDLVPECTNISVGYFDQHGSYERLDYVWLKHIFMPAVLKVDFSKLVTKRNPKETTTYGNFSGYSKESVTHWRGKYSNSNIKKKTWKEADLTTDLWDLPDWYPHLGWVDEAKPAVLLKAIKRAITATYSIEDKDRLSEFIFKTLELNKLYEDEVTLLNNQINLLKKKLTGGEVQNTDTSGTALVVSSNNPTEDIAINPQIKELNKAELEDKQLKAQEISEDIQFRKNLLKEILVHAKRINLFDEASNNLLKVYVAGGEKYLDMTSSYLYISDYSKKELRKLNKILYQVVYLLCLEPMDEVVEDLLIKIYDYIGKHNNEEGFELVDATTRLPI